jgi:hypothetical protein
MNAAGSAYDASASPPLVSQGATGARSGGILRPGSIDQGVFLQMLQQQQQNRAAAGVGGKPVAMQPQAFQGNIPTLTSAQFAALVGASSENPPIADADDGAAADPQAAAQSLSRVTAPTAAAQAAPLAASTAMKLTGRPAAAANTAQASADPDAPIFSRAGEPQLAAATATAAASGATNDAAASDADPVAADGTGAAGKGDDDNAGDAKSADTAKTPPSDPNVVHLKDAPDRETQRNLMAAHKRWIVDETPGSRQLFFGADGKFGWDDFLDVINPLQHIPIVAQIYRAVTGDQINGAAELIGALPLGPLGMVGFMGTVADLAVKDTTGKGIGENLEAMVFGDGKDKSGTGSTPGDASDLAEAAPAHPSLGIQTASAEPAAMSMDASRTAHDQRRG